MLAPAGDTSIVAKDVQINAGHDTTTRNSHSTYSKVVLGGTVSIPVVSAVQGIQSLASAEKTAGNERMTAFAAVTAGMQAADAVKGMMADSLPERAQARRLGFTFDFIVLLAVWMHVPPASRARALRTLATLLAPNGRIASFASLRAINAFELCIGAVFGGDIARRLHCQPRRGDFTEYFPHPRPAALLLHDGRCFAVAVVRRGRGRPPIGVARILRMCVAQQCFGLSDEGIEDAIDDSQAVRNFVGVDLTREIARLRPRRQELSRDKGQFARYPYQQRSVINGCGANSGAGSTLLFLQLSYRSRRESFHSLHPA